MKKLLLILIPFIVACKSQISREVIERKIDLKNNLGQLTIDLPSELDTAYSWIKLSDNKCDEYAMFRFADKDYSLLQETGFVYTVLPDSLYQLTIQQPRFMECGEVKAKIDSVFLEYLVKLQFDISSNIRISLKEIRTINNYDYAILATSSEQHGNIKLKLVASTLINGQFIWIEFNYLGKAPKDFIKRMDNSLNTIKITSANRINGPVRN